jgi:hypothetical protein
MPMETLACPNCGAPLNVWSRNPIVVCLYCDTVVRIHGETAEIDSEITVSHEEMEQIKQLATSGQRTVAIQRYHEVTHLPLPDAEHAIEGMIKQFSLNTLRHLPLSPVGWGMLLIYIIGLVGGLVLGVRGTLPPFIFIPIVLFTGFNVVILSRNITTSVRYMGAKKAQAVVQNFTHIGQVKILRNEAHLFKVWLEVQPDGEPPFQSELTLSVRGTSLEKLHQGKRIWVKYPPDDRQKLIYWRNIETA